MTLPAFEDLPLDPAGPELNAWGLYGKDDEKGRLNLVTPEAVKRGVATIQEGLVVNLNLPLSLRGIHPARKGLEHTINARGNCVDDHVSFNTQASTQWDGLRHFPAQDFPSPGEHRSVKLGATFSAIVLMNSFYNGQTYEEATDPTSTRNGTQNLCERGLTSCAHLLDVPRYLEQNGLPPIDPFTADSAVPIETLLACMKAQGNAVSPGDIVLVRTGYAEAYTRLSDDELAKLGARTVRQSTGIKMDRGMLKWLWDSGFAAIAADCPAVESAKRPGRLLLHEVGLAGWGMILGEMFDLEQLAKECDRLSRWTFLMTSMPLYIPGGIASPPNAQAIL